MKRLYAANHLLGYVEARSGSTYERGLADSGLVYRVQGRLTTSRSYWMPLQRLIASGGSVLIIEHNLEVIRAADWVIDLEPEGGDRVGRIVAQGTPDQIAQVAGSYTGQSLKPALSAWKDVRVVQCGARYGSF
jgi:hypothetical protein